ncbi:acyl-CoA thioesterase [Synechococcus sp. RSCCF101]|uniref:acyl-CoA thioesterase n=1 Tax=Synechococcus sp. RSCCF101 TaxID=2511069 RepID=UPI00351A059D
MWHGAYLAWLEEARVGALEQAGLPYHRLVNQGVELPVVSLRLDYRQPLLLGDAVEVRSHLRPRRGVRLHFVSRMLSPRGGVAAEAEVVLAPVAQTPAGPVVIKRLPTELRSALETLETRQRTVRQ